MRPIPSLNGLRAFECAARLGSFTAAAAELSVTQAAVSRMVKVLESQLGYALFTRHANALVLTPEGALLGGDLTGAFNALGAAVRRVEAARGRPVLTLGVGPTFAMRWLIPRLAFFQQENPGIEVRVATSGAAAELRSDWSCSMRMGSSAAPGVVSVPLFSADLFPVCAPALLRRLATPADLARTTLLEVAHAPDDWALWLRAARLISDARAFTSGDAFPRRLRFDFYAFALQAAIDGLGVALGLQPYVADDLAAGRLVAPFRITVPKTQGWYLLHREGGDSAPALRAFIDWATTQAAATRKIAVPHARKARRA